MMSILLPGTFIRLLCFISFLLPFTTSAYSPHAHGRISHPHDTLHYRSRRQSTSDALQLFNSTALTTASDTISSACANALAAPLNCSTLITFKPYEYYGLTADNITTLCTADCSESINQFRQAVLQECANDVYTDPVINNTDVIYGTSQTYDVYNINDVSMKPIGLADYWFINYNLTCMQDDSDPPSYCYLKNRPQNTTSEGVDLDACDVCSLKALRETIENDQTYEDDIAAQYSSLSSSCGITLGPVATPSPVYLTDNATLVQNVSATATCTGSYVPVATGDSCDNIAEANSISTDSLLQINGLPGGCAGFPNNLTSLCIQGSCTPRIVEANDTCTSLAAAANATVVQLLTWNTGIDPLCINLSKQVGHVICLSNPLGYTALASASVGGAPTGATTAAPVPTDAANQSNTDCGLWYEVNPGDYCAYVCTKNAISLSDFYFLNPELDSNCTNLWANTSYCVGAVGDISTYSGYSVSTATITDVATLVTTADPAWTTMTSVFTPTYNFTATATALPLANDSLTDCYYTYENTQGNVPCSFAADEYGISVLDFVSWNPSLGDPDYYTPENCTLANATQYCGVYYDPSLLPNTTTTSDYYVADDAATNSTTDCEDWWEVGSGDTCDLICKSSDIPFSSFYSWNPSVGADCENLWANTSYCVAGPGWENVTYNTNTSTTSVVSVVSSTSNGGAPAATQSGIVAGCDEWYVAVSGDSCSSIANNYSISVDQFENWNPAVGSDCSGLWANEAYCVHVPGATTTTAATSTAAAPSTTSVQPPGPTQTGIASNCNAYAIPASGDGCSSFADSYSVTLAQLYEWNPALGDDCSNFWTGEAYCIGVSS